MSRRRRHGEPPAELVDRAWYRRQYRDVADAHVDPVDHYLGTGWREGRDPNPLFDTDWYLAQNPGITTDPLTHYTTLGWREGRDPSPFFQVTWYLTRYPDVASADVEPLAHYLRSGFGQGRLTCWLQEALPDLAPWLASPFPGSTSATSGGSLVWLTEQARFHGGGVHPDLPARPVVMDRRGHTQVSGRAYIDSPEAFVSGPIGPTDCATEEPLGWQDPSALAVDVSATFSMPSINLISLPAGTAGTILWIDNQTPHPQEDSGSVRAQALIRMAQGLGYAIAFVPSFEPVTSPHVRNLAASGVLVARTADLALEVLARHGRRPSLVWISRPESARHQMTIIRRVLPDVPVVYDTVDAHFVRLAREYRVRPSDEVARDLSELVPAEADAIEAADMVIALTDADAEVIRSRHPRARISVIGNVHVSLPPPSFEETRGVVFVGSFLHRPNIDAVEWLVEEIWPLVPEVIREDGLTIVGSFPPPRVRDLAWDGVQVLANVADSDNVVRTARVSIAPLRFGAGLKGKVGQSLALGIPVVGTPIAFEGVSGAPGDGFLEAASASELAATLSTVYHDRNRWKRLSGSAIRASAMARIEPVILDRALRGLGGPWA